MKLYKERKFMEMAEVIRLNNIQLIIWSNDHTPAHFHAVKRGEYDVRILIPKETMDNYKDLVILPKSKGEIPKKDLEIIFNWINNKQVVKGLEIKLMGYQQLIFAWNINHPEDKI